MSESNLSRRDIARGIGMLAAAAQAGLSVAEAQPVGSSADAAVRAAYEKYRGLNEGKNADYIPALAKVPSNYFGIALVTPQGATSTAGDITPAFSIQSISKVFTMALVFRESGESVVENAVGVDATGQVFNSIVAVEQFRGKEMNPLVNPGAIATTGTVKGANATEVWNKIIGIHNDFAGRKLDVDQEVYKSEAATNQRNRAISMLMSAYERFPAIRRRRSISIRVNARLRSPRRISASWRRHCPMAAKTRSPKSRCSMSASCPAFSRSWRPPSLR